MMNPRMDSTPARQPRGPPQQQQCKANMKQDDMALGFAQGSDKKPTAKKQQADTLSKSSSSSRLGSRGSKITTVICKLCGKQGHISSVCPRKPPEQIHAMATKPDDASESSDALVTLSATCRPYNGITACSLVLLLLHVLQHCCHLLLLGKTALIVSPVLQHHATTMLTPSLVASFTTCHQHNV